MIGSDFELFILREDGHYMPVPEHVDIGSKNGEHVQLVGGTMHRDNVMVELCPEPVTDSAALMATRCLSLIEQAEAHMSGLLGEVVTLDSKPTVRFPSDQLASMYAQEIGCDRDYLAQSGDVISRLPLNAGVLGDYRCGAGHIHVSYGVTDKVPSEVAVPMADLLLGTLETTFGKQGRRRKYYGMHGLFRPKTYGSNVKGIEYRSTSNLWLSNRDRMEAMIGNALALESILINEPLERLYEALSACYPALVAQEVMEKENVAEARGILALTQQIFPEYVINIGE